MISNALDHAAAACGEQPAEAFGPVALKAVRERMVARGLARSTINGGINWIRRAFNWDAADELIRSKCHSMIHPTRVRTEHDGRRQRGA